MGRLLSLAALLLVSGGFLGAEGRFRADDGNFWRLHDNPSLVAASGDLFALGYSAFSDPQGWSAPSNELKMISPLVSFDYSWQGSNSTLGVGTAVRPFSSLSLGYRGDTITTGGNRQSTYNFGMLYRPWDLVSAGITVDDAFGPNRLWGAGLALRPFTLWQPGGDGLTLTADASWTPTQWTWERWGARWSWQSSDLRVWYDALTGLPGVELTLAWGPSETMGSLNRAGEALRWSSRTPEVSAFGSVILRIRGTGPLLPSSIPPGLINLRPPRWDLPGLKFLLDRAARDGQIVAVVFEDPPTVLGLAGAEELRDSLERLKKAGKKVYVHADSYDDSLGYQGWISAADRVVLDPSGGVDLVAGGSRRLYLKGFLDKIGVEFVNFAPWDTKSFFNNLTASSMPDGERAMLKRYLTDRDALAAAALGSGRGPRLHGDPATAVAQGPYLEAQQALDLGLIDQIQTRAEFEEALRVEHPGISFVDDVPIRRNPGWGPSITRRTVAVVHLVGDIVGGPGEAGRSIGRDAVTQLQRLRDDPEFRAVLLEVDSPGGAVLPSAALADEVRKTVAAGKPVVVVMGDVAGSGGYYLSAPASRIFAEPGTLTGSIGVTSVFFSAQKTLDLLGIKADGVDQAPSAAFGDWTRPLSDQDRQKWASKIQSLYQRFVKVVADGRHLDPARLEPLARGQIYTGREALALGLVDELGDRRQAQAWLEQQLGGRVEWTDFYPGETHWLGDLFEPFTDAALESSTSPTLRLARTLDRTVGPVTQDLTGVVARGPGPQVWVDAP